MNDNKQFINTFISKIKQEYPRINIGYDYDEEVNYYDIWHDNEKLQFKNIEFLRYVGILMKEILYANNVSNFSFGYDYERG